MKITTLNLKLTFTEPLLGSANNNKEIHSEFIAAKAETAGAAAEEVEAINIAGETEKAKTVFPSDIIGIHLWDYQIRGFFKETVGIMVELGDCKLSKWLYKKAVNSLLFVSPRRIYLTKPDGTPYLKAPEELQRPLAAETMQGPRVCLATSEQVPAGTSIAFTVKYLTGSNAKSKLDCIDETIITQALDYGALKGCGQWRSGGFGRFSWERV